MLFESLKTLPLFIQTRIDALWGYDVFIAHRRADAADYAHSLFTLLRGAGVAGFIDRVVYGPGDSLLVSTQRHARKSSLLVVIGSPQLLPERKPLDWVAEEISAYLDSHTKDPKVLVVTFGAPVLDALVNVGSVLNLTTHPTKALSERLKTLTELKAAPVIGAVGTLSVLSNLAVPEARPPAPEFLKPLRPFLRIVQPLEALQQKPSEEVLKAILWQLKSRRRDRTRLRVFQVVAAALTALSVGLIYFLLAEIQQRAQAEQHLQLARSQVVAADARLIAPSELNAALRQSVEAYQINPSDDARAALLDGLDRAAQIVGFYPCENGSIAGGVAFSTDAEPAVAFSCIRDHTSVVTVVAHNGKIRNSEAAGEVRTLAFVSPGFLALDGTSTLRIMDVPTGRLSEFDAGKEPLSNIITVPGRDALLTVQAPNRIRIWNHQRSALPDSSWKSTDPLTVPTSIWDIDFDPTNGVVDIRGFDGSSYIIPVVSDPVAGVLFRFDSGDPARVEAVSGDTRCPQYPIVTRTNLRVSSHSADRRIHAYLTEANDVIVKRVGDDSCSVLHGNTHNAQIAVSPDGQRIATLGAYLSSDTVHGLILWDLGQHHPLAKVIWPNSATPQSGFSKVVLSHDGSSWAFVRPGGEILWTGRRVTATQDPNVPVTAAALSRDGLDLSIGYVDGSVARFVVRRPDKGNSTAQPSKGVPIELRPLVHLGSQSIGSLWYVDSDAYAIDEEGSAWKMPVGEKPTRLALGRDSSDYPCQTLTQSGTDLVVETQSVGKKPVLESLNTLSGSTSRFELPSDSRRCKSLVYSAPAHVAVRIPQEYTDMYIFEPGKNPAFRPFPNPLHDISGLRKVLTNPVLSADGTTLAAIASEDQIALFDVVTARLVGTLKSPHTNALAISGDGKKLLSYNEHIGVILWDIDAGNWARIAANMAGADPRGLQ